jgi:hypothetical protein
MSNPIRSPRSFDGFTLDGAPCPGKAKIGDGRRTREWQEQQQPGTTGSIVVMRRDHVVHLEYKITVWTDVQYEALKLYLAKLVNEKDLRPTPTYTLSDLRNEHNKVKRVAYAFSDPIDIGDEPQTWMTTLGLIEKPLVKQTGGPLKAPSNPREELITKLGATNQVLDGALANMDAARRAKK